ncbi:hypothetical protein SS50377_21915 [Spironucleus salmonicida]|uniref:Uncharacterized protein n=1 Tax=Spironucleus salmonicida TaxID=348837 RepID=V6LIN2_9EUKA|nr:hypothetical protein SS50377_21915 [Spironucleus salmonicida]|eukprot:EST44455.1 Hypothetical protein SS50377_15764 [Spironucleus salmonicida]
MYRATRSANLSSRKIIDEEPQKPLKVNIRSSAFNNKNYVEFRKQQKQFVNYPTDSVENFNERNERQKRISQYLHQIPACFDFSDTIPSTCKSHWLPYARHSPHQKLTKTLWI